MTEINHKEPGLLLYAKRSGPTSFNALWDIKKALDTKKIGHTGTLDSFADGLLVVLSNGATKLVSQVTNFDKKYETIIAFGKETDTLDPLGKIILESKLPRQIEIEEALKKFRGKIEQSPPIYSSIYINGQRASDLARDGEKISMKKREVEIFSLELLAVDNPDAVSFAHIRCHVSKGTYIRSLARDIAQSIGVCAHLTRLRRTSVGPFSLEHAVYFEELPVFNLDLVKTPVPDIKDYLEKLPWQAIRDAHLALTPKQVEKMGFTSLCLKSEYETLMENGIPPKAEWFYSDIAEGESFVFSKKEKLLAGIIKSKNKLGYGFVLKDQ